MPHTVQMILLLAAPAMASAADRADSSAEAALIDTILVTGTRIEQTAAETGSSVRIISADEIEALGFSHALDAVATAPGVTVNQNGAFGGAATVRIRGASSSQTLVLIDGVSVNDASSPGGGFDFARLDTDKHRTDRDTDAAPQSTLWVVPDAIGGPVDPTSPHKPRRDQTRRRAIRPGRGSPRHLFVRRRIGGPWRRGRRLPPRRHWH